MGKNFVSLHKNPVVAVFVAGVLGLASELIQPGIVHAQAQACADLADTYGRITLPKASNPVTITDQTEFSVWIRMRVQDAAHKVTVSVDSNATSSCGVEVGAPSGTAANTWFWTKTKAAGGDFKVAIPASSNVKIQIAGQSASPNVDIDKVMLISDSCEPDNTTFGENCTQTPTATPTSGPTPTTPVGDVQKFDIATNRVIDAGDLSIVIRDYDRPTQPSPANSPADFDGSGKVNIIDLGQLIKMWGQTY